MANDFSDLLRLIPRGCPACGRLNMRTRVHCGDCGERLRLKRPIVRAVVTLLAIAFAAAFLYWRTT